MTFYSLPTSLPWALMPLSKGFFFCGGGHDYGLAGHMRIKKTLEGVLRNFFWPGVKSDVAEHFGTCHACQTISKPNQKIPPAPLHPIPSIGEPFGRILLDCVGPHPRTKSGNQYLLTYSYPVS